jgi:DNA-binding transcriptional ArsR family regulator
MSTILVSLFSSSARVEVLALFLRNSERSFYQREIERETGQPIRAVQREVERFEGAGLLLRSEEGNRVFFRLDPDHPLVAELRALFQKALGIAEISAPAPVRAVPAAGPSARQQPFPWLETPAQPPLPPRLRPLQNSGEWDRAY